jgi:hypothetical protein
VNLTETLKAGQYFRFVGALFKLNSGFLRDYTCVPTLCTELYRFSEVPAWNDMKHSDYI